MTSLLLFKEYLKSFYNKYSSGIQPAVKFLFALAMFAALNMNLGYMTQLTNPLVVVLLCLVSAVLPVWSGRVPRGLRDGGACICGLCGDGGHCFGAHSGGGDSLLWL